MNPISIIEKWISEHGSAAVLRDHIALLKEQMAIQQKEIARLKAENAVLKKKNKKLGIKCAKLEKKTATLANPGIFAAEAVSAGRLRRRDLNSL